MAADRGHADRSVAARLAAAPHQFEYFQAVSLLERIRADAVSVGEGVHPSREAVEFNADPSLVFPASEIAALEAPQNDRDPWRMRVSFLSLAGVQGPLPRPYTERMLGSKTRTGPIRAFLDMFHHRLLSIFYRARRRRRVTLDAKHPEESIAAPMLRAMVGLGTEGLANRMAVPDRALMRYAGLLTLRPRSAGGLRALVASYFNVPVRVSQFVGRWRTLEDADTTRLGSRRHMTSLGEGAVLGTRVWDQSAAVRITLGPLSAEQYQDFLPTGRALQPLRDLAAFYVGPSVDVEIQLVLHASETPAARLDSPAPPSLGWTSWLGLEGRTEHPQVAIGEET
jgi:type VI secretion system protein ImpH